jgi:hypothetical protein
VKIEKIMLLSMAAAAENKSLDVDDLMANLAMQLAAAPLIEKLSAYSKLAARCMASVSSLIRTEASRNAGDDTRHLLNVDGLINSIEPLVREVGDAAAEVAAAQQMAIGEKILITERIKEVLSRVGLGPTPPQRAVNGTYASSVGSTCSDLVVVYDRPPMRPDSLAASSAYDGIVILTIGGIQYTGAPVEVVQRGVNSKTKRCSNQKKCNPNCTYYHDPIFHPPGTPGVDMQRYIVLPYIMDLIKRIADPHQLAVNMRSFDSNTERDLVQVASFLIEAAKKIRASKR